MLQRLITSINATVTVCLAGTSCNISKFNNNTVRTFRDGVILKYFQGPENVTVSSRTFTDFQGSVTILVTALINLLNILFFTF